jgi:hypothetical protein
MRRTVALALAVLSLAGCTGGNRGAGVPRAVGTSSAPVNAVATDILSQELRFVACMRQQGIADMPDPVPGDTDGRSAVRYALDVMGKGSDDAFQAALDKCVSLLPPAPPEPTPPAQDLQKYLAFAKCMRDNGVPDFPDPQPGTDGRVSIYEISPDPTSTGHVSLPPETLGGLVLDIGDPRVKAAMAHCKIPDR